LYIVIPSSVEAFHLLSTDGILPFILQIAAPLDLEVILVA